MGFDVAAWPRDRRHLLPSLAQDDTTMVYLAHEMRLACQVADQMVFLDRGEVVNRGRRIRCLRTR